jgi:hypothetical protein
MVSPNNGQTESEDGGVFLGIAVALAICSPFWAYLLWFVFWTPVVR